MNAWPADGSPRGEGAAGEALPGEHVPELSSLVGMTALVEGAGSEATGLVAEIGPDGPVILCDGPPGIGDGDRVSISVFSRDALHRLAGPARVDGLSVGLPAGTPIERIQRRKWPRRRMDMPVTLCPVADGLRVEGIPGRTVDIGVGGVCVETLRPVEGEGDPMVILSLPDGTSIVSGAVTVSSEDLGDGFRYRLAFRDLDAHDTGRLAGLASE